MRASAPLLLLSLAFLAACSADPGSETAAETPIRFAVTDIEGLEQLQLDFGPFRDALKDATGMPFEFFAVGSRTAVVEALKAGQVDIVMAGPAEYVVIAKRTQARPLVGLLRPDYNSAIITTKESGVTDIGQLKGKKVAFGDTGSTARHLMPMQMFADAGIDPLNDLEVLHTADAVMHEALKKGDIAAMAQSYGSWQKTLFANEPPEVQETFVVLLESDPLPADVLVAGNHVDDATVQRIRQAFLDHADTLKTALSTTEENAKYRTMEFVPEISDADYDHVRMMYKTVGYPEYAEFIEEE